MPPLLRPTRLAAKVARWIAALVAALLVASGALNLHFAWRENLAHIDALQAEKARGAAMRIRLYVADIEQQLGWTLLPAGSATPPPAPDGVPPELAQRRIEFLKLLRQAPAITDASWIDPDGREQLRVSRLLPDTLGHALPRGSDPAFTGTTQGRTWRSGVTFRKGTEPYLRVARRAGAGGGVTVVDINLKFVWEAVTSLAPGPGGVAYVVDQRGTLIAHPDIGLVLKKTDLAALPQVRAALSGRAADVEAAGRSAGAAVEGAEAPGADAAVEAIDLAGRPVLAAAAPIEPLGWTVLVESPREQALAPVVASAWRLAGALAAGLALAAAASVLLARSLTRPIGALTEGAERIGAGDLEHRIEVHTRDEVQLLAERFNAMAASLQASVAGLERRVAERTHELAQANEAKSHFIAAASHDLRQPVHALGLFVGQLRSAHEPAAQRELMAHIEQSVAAFEALLGSLLDISRLDAGAVAARPEAVALAPLLARLARGHTGTAQRRRLRLAVRVLPQALVVQTDPVLLERIVDNLLTNALRHTAEGGVLIAARRRRGPLGSAPHVQLRVIDTGCGIAAEELPRVFREFYRVPRPAAEAGGAARPAPAASEPARAGREADPGLGLGLAIVRRLTDLLGHRLDVRSVPGRGTVFTLELPLAPSATAATAAHAFDAQAAGTGHEHRGPDPGPGLASEVLRGRRVLIVDDDAAVRTATRGTLRQWGVQVEEAADEAEAIAAFERHAHEAPELVLGDLRLAGGASGLQLAQHLAARHRVPVAVLTGETDPATLAAVRAAGLPCLTKPLRPARLRAQLEAMLAAKARQPIAPPR
jgi:signal transduction histidine kinase/ActR/RegA family two-component response regulator